MSWAGAQIWSGISWRMNGHIRAIPSIFDHTALDSSTIESYYQPQQPGSPISDPREVRGGGAAAEARPGDVRAGVGSQPSRYDNQLEQPIGTLPCPGEVCRGRAVVAACLGNLRGYFGSNPSQHTNNARKLCHSFTKHGVKLAIKLVKSC